MTGFAGSERRALAELLLTVGPDAPTLCAGWTTRDLAAHVVVRDRRPDAVAGLTLAPLRGHGERVRARAAAGDYQHLVRLVREPPWWSLVSNPLVDAAANTVEFFVHHEDVRRAQPGWRARELPPQQQAALWSRARLPARLGLRRFPGSVLVQAPGHGELRAGAGGPAVRLVGTPAELTLFLSGRQPVARVQVDGPAELAARLRAAKLGV